MIGLSAVFGLYNWATLKHDHQDKTDLPYLKIRNKPFPWGCSNCDLFDYDCWRECRGGAKKEEHH